VSHSGERNIQNQGSNLDESDVETEEDFLDEAELAELNRRCPTMSEAMANEVCLRLFFSPKTLNFFHRYHCGTLLTALLELSRAA
jgi:hypothetical protein